MIEPKHLKKGMLVWWTASRYSSDWSCPCLVTEVNRSKNIFRVTSFDDMKETEDLFIIRKPGDDQSSLTEMRQINVEEAEDYFESRKGELQEAVHRAEVELSRKTEALQKYNQKVIDTLSKLR